jgi:hypothetical protein
MELFCLLSTHLARGDIHTELHAEAFPLARPGGVKEELRTLTFILMQTLEQNRNSWVSQFWSKIWMTKKEKQSFNNRDLAMLYLTFEITKKK